MEACSIDGEASQPPLFGSASARNALCIKAEGYVVRANEMMNRARVLVQGDRVGAVSVLTANRVRLCEHFQGYQRFKHTQIFDPVVSYGRPSSKIVAHSMKVDCLTLGETFAAYHNRWLGLTAGEWVVYRRDMLSTTETMASNLRAEMRAIKQLLMIADLYTL